MAIQICETTMTHVEVDGLQQLVSDGNATDVLSTYCPQIEADSGCVVAKVSTDG